MEFPPVTALLSAAARVLFGWSLTGFRLFAILSGAAVTLLAALVVRELRRRTTGTDPRRGAGRALADPDHHERAFQPVSFDQLTTMTLLWLALRLALGRGSWAAIGVAAGIGLETKYTLGVVLVLLLAGFLAWRRDVLFSRGLLLAAAIAAVLMIPNIVWEAGHGWVSVHWFLHPPPSGSDETRPGFIANLVLGYAVIAFPVAVAGMVSLLRNRLARPLGFAAAATPVAYFVLGGKSYYAAPAVLFALAAGAGPLDRWLTVRRAWAFGAVFALVTLFVFVVEMPALPLHTRTERASSRAAATSRRSLPGRGSCGTSSGRREARM